jgi:DNA-binding MarR family transcriptional regulator
MNFRRASRAITRIYDQALEPSGLKVTQFSLLMNIDAYGPLNITALAKLVTLDRTTLVRNLKPLESAEMIVNAPSDDPRERQVSLTKQGRLVITKALPQWKGAQRKIKETVGPENLHIVNQLTTLLEGLVSELNTHTT